MATATDPRLGPFLDQLHHRDLNAAAWQIRQHVIDSGGCWMEPGEATHLFEISLYGITDRGMGRDEAVGNWITTADDTLIRARTASLPDGMAAQPDANLIDEGIST